MEDVDRKLEKAGKKGHKYVKRSFERRRERIRKKWITTAGRIIEAFREYLKETIGCEL